MIRLEAMEVGPPQTLVWFNGLVALNEFLMDVIEAAGLLGPEAEYDAVAVIPGTLFHPEEFEVPLERTWAAGGDHCGKDAEDEEIAGEAAEREAELAVVKPFTYEAGDEPLEPLTEL